MGVKKISEEKRKRASIRQKQPVQWNPITRRNIVRPKFYKNKPLSNHDLIKWCKYLRIPRRHVLSRDEKVHIILNKP